ncbi:hypothetical protein D1007_22914 [Hordeum vulgare]|nr:hypothetical protein D1007_22914 [Hordeum vulgare]
MASLFGHVEPAPKDPIIGVTEAFLGDPSLDKVNVGVGAYRDESDRPVVLDCVREAERRIAGNLNMCVRSPFPAFLRSTPSCYLLLVRMVFDEIPHQPASAAVASGGGSGLQCNDIFNFGGSASDTGNTCTGGRPGLAVKLLQFTHRYFSFNRVTSDYITGDCLDDLLSKLIRSVEVAKASRGGLPEKIWMKALPSLLNIMKFIELFTADRQQFSVGVNDVTRVLERMPAAAASRSGCSSKAPTSTVRRRAPLVPLQAVIIAADCNPKWLTKHIPTLASTRQVPVLCLKDNKGSSLRLGQVANVRTALAIGIKARDSIINKAIDEILKDYKPGDDEQ